jgi:hypothetical protein
VALYGSLDIKEGIYTEMFEKRVLRRIFGPKRGGLELEKTV